MSFLKEVWNRLLFSSCSHENDYHEIKDTIYHVTYEEFLNNLEYIARQEFNNKKRGIFKHWGLIEGANALMIRHHYVEIYTELRKRGVVLVPWEYLTGYQESLPRYGVKLNTTRRSIQLLGNI